MQNQEGLTPAERELETVLAGLKPHVAAMNRDRLMFEAGRASAGRGNRLWQGLTASLAVTLLVSVLIRPKPAVIETPGTLVADNVQSITTPQFEPVEQERLKAFRQYVQTRRTVLERGVEALRSSSTHRDARDEPLMTRQSVKEFLSST